MGTWDSHSTMLVGLVLALLSVLANAHHHTVESEVGCTCEPGARAFQSYHIHVMFYPDLKDDQGNPVDLIQSSVWVAVCESWNIIISCRYYRNSCHAIQFHVEDSECDSRHHCRPSSRTPSRANLGVLQQTLAPFQ